MKKSIIILIAAIVIVVLIGCFYLGRNSSKNETEAASIAQTTESIESADEKTEATAEPNITESISEVPEVSEIPEITESEYTLIQEVPSNEIPDASADSGVDENEIDIPITLS